MALFEMPVGLTDPNGSVPKRRQYATLIPAMSSILSWVSLRTDYATVASDKFTDLTDRSGNSTDWAQATAANQPAVTAAAVNGHEAGTFDGTDYFARTSFPAGSHWMACVFKMSALNASAIQILMGTQSSQKYHINVAQNARYLQYRVGSTNTASADSGQFTLDQWHYFIASFASGTGVASITLDGAAVVTGTNASATSSNGNIGLGANHTGTFPFTGLIADAMYGNVDLLDGTHADDVQLLKDYFAGAYGIAAAA